MTSEEYEGTCDWCGRRLSCEDYDGMCADCAFEEDQDDEESDDA
jgi:hypothetical protein